MTGKRSPSNLMALVREVASVSGVSADEIIRSVEAAAGRAASEHAGQPVTVRLDPETGRFHRLDSGPAGSEEADRAPAEAEASLLVRPVLRAAREELEDRLRASRLLAGGERFRNRIGMLETGRVVGREGGDLIVDLGASRARLPAREQSRHEVFNPDDVVRAVVVSVVPEDPPVILSRTVPGVVAGALEREAPEVRSGVVRVRGVARDPGVRAKVAVASESRDVDPVACCLGPGGSRIRAVSRELRGERVDVVRWHPDPAVFARHALRPAEVLSVTPDPEDRGPGALQVLVTEHELPRALGKRGQNVRLAAELLGVSLEVRAPDAGERQDRGESRGERRGFRSTRPSREPRSAPRPRGQETDRRRGAPGHRRREDRTDDSGRPRRGGGRERPTRPGFPRRSFPPRDPAARRGRAPGPFRGNEDRAAHPESGRSGRKAPGDGDSLPVTNGPEAGAEEVGAHDMTGSKQTGGAV